MQVYLVLHCSSFTHCIKKLPLGLQVVTGKEEVLLKKETEKKYPVHRQGKNVIFKLILVLIHFILFISLIKFVMYSRNILYSQFNCSAEVKGP